MSQCETLPRGNAGRTFLPVSPFRKLLAWAEIASQRRALARLDGRLLRDVGLDRKDAAREAARARWDAPDHWLE